MAGSWAGHCFDIVLLEEHDDEVRNSHATWVDRTGEVCDEMAKVKRIV